MRQDLDVPTVGKLKTNSTVSQLSVGSRLSICRAIGISGGHSSVGGSSDGSRIGKTPRELNLISVRVRELAARSISNRGISYRSR